MEISIILLTIVIGSLILFILNQLYHHPKPGIPHVPVIPILGSKHGHSFFTGNPITETCNKIYNEFPGSKYYGLLMFNTPTIVLKDPDLIQNICIKNFNNAPDHRSFIDERMDPILGKNVFSLKGERWREVRSTLSPSFTATKMKFMYQLVSKVSDNFIKYIIDNPEFSKLFEVKEALSRYTSDVIATTAFGLSVDSMKDRENEFYLKGKDAVNLSGFKRVLKFSAGIIVPRLMRLMGQTYLSKDTNKFFLNLIRDTVKMRDEQHISRPDMIHLLMQARDSASVKMTIDDITAQAFIFFFAGYETSSSVASFILHELAYHQDVQDKLRDEVVDVLGGGGGGGEDNNNQGSYESLGKLKYMDMVINETLRLYPPVVILDRCCTKAMKIPSLIPGNEDVLIEPGTTFWIPVFSLHRDPKYFPQPELFDPERFNGDNQKNIYPYTFNPFGIGPRKCIAERFAMMEIKLVIAGIISKFIVKPSEKSTKILKFSRNSLNLAPEGGIWLRFEKINIK